MFTKNLQDSMGSTIEAHWIAFDSGVLPYSSGWLGTHSTVQAGIQLILLPGSTP